MTKVEVGEAADSRGSRERILESAIRLLRRQGYSSTGIKQIVEEGNALAEACPRGRLLRHGWEYLASR